MTQNRTCLMRCFLFLQKCKRTEVYHLQNGHSLSNRKAKTKHTILIDRFVLPMCWMYVHMQGMYVASICLDFKREIMECIECNLSMLIWTFITHAQNLRKAQCGQKSTSVNLTHTPLPLVIIIFTIIIFVVVVVVGIHFHNQLTRKVVALHRLVCTISSQWRKSWYAIGYRWCRWGDMIH